jgi:hypothetical protein
MKKTKRRAFNSIILVIGMISIPFAGFTQDDDEDPVPFVDGEMWGESTREEKVSYVVGLSNLLDTEYAFQQKSGNAPTDQQSFIATLWENIDDLTVDQFIERVDSWYANNPGDLDTVVIDVVWVDMVEPNLK